MTAQLRLGRKWVVQQNSDLTRTSKPASQCLWNTEKKKNQGCGRNKTFQRLYSLSSSPVKFCVCFCKHACSVCPCVDVCVLSCQNSTHWLVFGSHLCYGLTTSIHRILVRKTSKDLWHTFSRRAGTQGSKAPVSGPIRTGWVVI